MLIRTDVPSPEELKARFLIPRPLLKKISEWLNLSESMTYQIAHVGGMPASSTVRRLEVECSIPSDLWEKDIDTRAYLLYSMWYRKGEFQVPHSETTPKTTTEERTETLEDLF